MLYPADWNELSEIPIQDKQAGVISEAVHDTFDAKVIVRISQGKLDDNFDINKSLSDVTAKLNSDLSNFKLISKDIVKFGKHSAIVVTYQYTSNLQANKQSQIIIPTQNKTYFLTLSAKSSDFDQINDFNKIKDSLSAYIDTH